jgi:hypothetical protein
MSYRFGGYDVSGQGWVKVTFRDEVKAQVYLEVLTTWRQSGLL